MKKAVWLACFLPLWSAAQQLKTTIDPLYGDTIYSTTYKEVSRKWGVFTAGEILSLSFVREKNQNLLKAFIITGNQMIVVKKQDSLNIKFSDGNIITLKSDSDFMGNFLDTKNSGSMITCYYPLLQENINDLKTKKVSLIRFHYQGKFIDYTIDDYDYKKIQKASQLLFP